MTLMDVMTALWNHRIEFRYTFEYGVEHVYVKGRKTNGFTPDIRISVEDGKIYRRNCGIVGFVTMKELLEEIRELM